MSLFWSVCLALQDLKTPESALTHLCPKLVKQYSTYTPPILLRLLQLLVPPPPNPWTPELNIQLFSLLPFPLLSQPFCSGRLFKPSHDYDPINTSISKRIKLKFFSLTLESFHNGTPSLLSRLISLYFLIIWGSHCLKYPYLPSLTNKTPRTSWAELAASWGSEPAALQKRLNETLEGIQFGEF